MSKKLFVGGFPYATTEDQLRDLFSQAGTVTNVIVLFDKMRGRPKGCGFVEFSTDEEGEKAKEMFNGQEFGGRSLTVNDPRPMEPRAPGGGYNNRGGDRGGDRGGYGGGYGGGRPNGGRSW